MPAINDFGKFLGKHAGELRSITDLVGLILPALPIGAQDRSRVEGIVGALKKASDNIERSAPSFTDVKVTVKKADVEAAVAARVDAAVETALSNLDARIKSILLELAKEEGGK